MAHAASEENCFMAVDQKLHIGSIENGMLSVMWVSDWIVVQMKAAILL